MKTSYLPLLVVTSLALALCACDSGDKKDAKEGAAPPVVKKSKVEKTEGATPGNPAPPESNEPVKEMNAPAAPGGVPSPDSGAGDNAETQLKMLNLAVSQYGQKAGTKSMMNQMMAQGKGGKPSGTGSGASSTLKSLDQLVTDGILKKIPDAPAGKKFVLDPKTQQVRMENK